MDPFSSIDKSFLAINKSWQKSYRAINWENLNTIDRFLKETHKVLTTYRTPNEQVKNCIKRCFEKVLNKYPLFFGYWKMYAAVTYQMYGSSQSVSILKQSVQKFPCSYELWVDYLKQLRTTEESEVFMRNEFETAATNIGNYFMSESFWESYLAFEKESSLQSSEKSTKILHIYQKVTKIPIYSYSKFYKQYKEFMKNTPDLSVDIQEVDTMFKKVSNTVNAIWAYESKIKQNYFTLSPVNEQQLDNWTKYFEFLLSSSSLETYHVTPGFIESCFERCLIPCYRYEYFWLSYCKWVLNDSSFDDSSKTKVFERSLQALPTSQSLNEFCLYIYKSRIQNNSDKEHILAYMEILAKILRTDPQNRLLFEEYFRFLRIKENAELKPVEYAEYLLTMINKYFGLLLEKRRNIVKKDHFRLLNTGNIDLLVVDLVRLYVTNNIGTSKTRKLFNRFFPRKEVRYNVDFWLEYYKFEKNSKNLASISECISRLEKSDTLPLAVTNSILQDFKEFVYMNCSFKDYTKMFVGNSIDPMTAVDKKQGHSILENNHTKKLVVTNKTLNYKKQGHPGLHRERPVIRNSIMKKNTKKRTKQKYGLPLIKNVTKLNSSELISFQK